ncbi:MBL fold metallo-hydrolase [Methanoregula sp.]|jgi:glyoxylase-like metal-dependent hydrolase (beta-lactamase superfamily II)|uniref:MBL fold metallo-hydrolase n=1 Tax=Methanoregula sp. TaxID=2052170 RepID=UPI003C2A0B68
MQITPHIHAIRTPLGPAPDRFVNVYLIYGDKITVIDTGFNGSEKLIYEDILSTGRDPADIGLVILTHAHPDHTGSAKVIRDLTSCMVAAHPSDAPFIEQVDPAMLKSPAPGIPPMVAGPVPVGRFLNEGDSINLGKGLTLEVLHTPGHSPESISLFLREESALFTGDTVQAPGRAPIYTDPVALVRSLRRLMDISGIRHYLPSHDMPAEGAVTYVRLKDSLSYIRYVHEIIKKAASAMPGTPDPQVLAGPVLAELGIPPGAGLPFIARTIHADLAAEGLDDIFNEK